MIKTVLSRPMTVVTVFVLLVLVGLFTVSDIPIDLMPDLSPPYVAVTTGYPAAGPEEVETGVTDVLEAELLNISGLELLTSTSSEGFSQILLEFSWGSDADSNADEVRRKIDEISNLLPDDARKPVVLQYDPNASPVMQIVLQGERSLDELTELADELVKPKLEQVADVAQVEVTGNRETIVEVALYQDRLSAYGLSAGQVASVLGSQNRSLGAGSFTSEGRDLLITTAGSFSSLDDIRDTQITVIPVGQEGRSVFLRDIANVRYALEDEESRVLVNGETGINLLAYKQSGANTVEVAENLTLVVDGVRDQLPEGIEIAILSDSSKIINQSLAQVLNAAVIGILCSVLVLLFFLRQIKSTMIVAVSIPVSILITILAMGLAGKTFNIIALTGLTLGVGMIVDASIVILENIFRHRQNGAPLEAAARFGTQEMIAPIAASILTTIAVFLPILIFGDEIGSFGAILGDLAFTVIMSLISSLVVAIFLVPVLSGHYLHIEVHRNEDIKNPVLRRIDGGIEDGLQAITRWYHAALKAVLQYRWLTVGVGVVLLVFSFMQVPKLGINLLPGQASESIQVGVELPVGTSLERTKRVLEQVEYFIEEEMTGYENLIQTAGSPSAREGSIVLGLPALEDRTVDVGLMLVQLEDIASRIPGIEYSIQETQGIGGGQALGGGSDVTVILSSTGGIDELYDLAVGVQALLDEEVPELRDLGIDMIRGLPQIEINIDRQKAFDQGLNSSNITNELRAQLSGLSATTFSTDGADYDVLVRLRPEDTLTLEDFDKIFIPNAQGQRVSLASFATLVENDSPVGIKHRDARRSVTVSASFVEGASANFVDAKVRELIASEVILPSNVSIEIGGAIDDIAETGSGLLMILALAALLVFGVMVSQFESLRAPFVVILAMPMLALGVIGIYLYMGVEFSMISLIGVIMLVGIVVNNGIVLVDYIALLRKRGSDLTEACLEGGTSRLRPILMTTLTTVLAMVPLAFFSGEGASLMQPLGITVVGGLTVNTVTTLIMVPVFYHLMFSREEEASVPEAVETEELMTEEPEHV
jgi:HAE1 family hydrophobic/amphiphilic exporter-1